MSGSESGGERLPPRRCRATTANLARSFNWGRGRKVPLLPRPLFHESVRTRFRDPFVEYVPGARFEKGIEEYVE